MNKRGECSNMKRKLIGILIIISMIGSIVANFGQPIYALTWDISGSDGWNPAYAKNNQNDYLRDQQTGSGSVSQDIVGDATYPSTYIHFTDTEIAFRIRVNNIDKGTNSTNYIYDGFAFIGMDVDLNGSIDFFMGTYNPSGNNGIIGIYGSNGALTNLGPSSTGIDGKTIFQKPSNRGVNYSLTMADSNIDGNPDYFVSYKLSVSDITAALLTKGITFNKSTSFRFITGTAAQDNSFNQDINGMNKSGWTSGINWDQLGVFSPTMSADSSASTYSVVFDANGGKYSDNSIAMNVAQIYGNKYLFPLEPTRLGYTFKGWNTGANGDGTIIDETTHVTDAKTIYSQWSPEKIAVSFNMNYDGGIAPRGITVDYESIYGTLPDNLPRDGYTFDGWYSEPVGGNKVESSTQVTNLEDHTLYAHWTGIDVKVSFDKQGGVGTANSKTVTFGSEYETLPIVNRTGYDFVGWYTEAIGGTKVTSSTQVTNTNEHTLYAHWKGMTYLVSFDSNGGSANPTTQTAIYGSAYGTMPSAGVKTIDDVPYYFEGWHTDATTESGILVTDVTTVTTAGNHILYAHWSKIKTFNIGYIGNGNTSGTEPIDGKHYTSNAEITVPGKGSLAKIGYTFKGWDTNSDGTTVVYDPSDENKNTLTIGATSITLYAVWEPDSVTVSFDTQTVEVDSPTDKTVTFDSEYGDLKTISRTGYDFLGWFNGAILGDEVVSTSKVTNPLDHTLYAQWKARTYYVTFKAQVGTTDWDVISSATAIYDKRYGQLPTAKKEGYTFNGWFTEETGGTQVENDTVVKTDGNHSLYAKWTKLGNAKEEQKVNGLTGVIVGNLQSEADSYLERMGINRFVKVLMTVSNVDESNGEEHIKTGVDSVKAIAQDSNITIGLYLDMIIEKYFKVNEADNWTHDGLITKTNDLIEVTVSIPENIQDKSSYVVYRYHVDPVDNVGHVDTITSTPNADGEYIVLDKSNWTLKLHVLKFSVYGIGYVTPNNSPNGGGGGTVESKPALNKEDHFAYMLGYPDNTFRPENNMTRAEAAVMFSRLMVKKMEIDKQYTSNFTDIRGNEWYANAIGYMEGTGIIKGYENNTFRPDALITRAEFAALASGFDNLSTGISNVFSDVDDANWAKDYISSASAKGWVKGYTDGTFKPENYITRAEVVTLVNRMLNRAGDKMYIDTNKNGVKQYIDLNNSHWAYYNIAEASNAHLFQIVSTLEAWLSTTK